MIITLKVFFSSFKHFPSNQTETKFTVPTSTFRLTIDDMTPERVDYHPKYLEEGTSRFNNFTVFTGKTPNSSPDHYSNKIRLTYFMQQGPDSCQTVTEKGTGKC